MKEPWPLQSMLRQMSPIMNMIYWNKEIFQSNHDIVISNQVGCNLLQFDRKETGTTLEHDVGLHCGGTEHAFWKESRRHAGSLDWVIVENLNFFSSLHSFCRDCVVFCRH
jgi:hypothetical protein